MFILHITTGLNDGGAEGVLYRLCKHDREFTHRVISLTGEGKYASLLRAQGIDVMCLGMSGFNAIYTFFRLVKLIKKHGPDVVQTWMYHGDLIGGLAARLAGVKSVVWNVRHSDFDPRQSKLMTRVIVRFCAWFSFRLPQKIICCAQQAASVHASLGYDKTKLVVVQNGFDLSRFYPDIGCRDQILSELNIDDVTILVGMVGRFNVQKNHKGLIDVLAQLKAHGKYKFCCLLIGAGMESGNASLTEWLKNAGLKAEVRLLGPRTDIPQLMSALDLHLLSSSFGEGFPNVLAEAMASGTPCVTTDVGDARDIVGDTGWVVASRDDRAFSQAIFDALEQMQTNRDEWEIRTQLARNRIETLFGLHSMLDRYHDVWKGCKLQ